MPAVITEAGFKDNADQRAFFASEKGPVMYATSVFQGICRYAEAGV